MRKTNLALTAWCAKLLWAGAAHAQRYVDHRNGTISDQQTGLMREKKTLSPDDVHYVDNRFTWSHGGVAGAKPDGTAFIDSLAPSTSEPTATTVTLQVLASPTTLTGDCRRSWNSAGLSIQPRPAVVPQSHASE